MKYLSKLQYILQASDTKKNSWIIVLSTLLPLNNVRNKKIIMHIDCRPIRIVKAIPDPSGFGEGFDDVTFI